MKPFLYQKLTQALLAELASGMYTEGKRFLSLRRIERLWNVSEPTACHAVRNLISANLIRPEPQRGFILRRGFQRNALLLLHKSPNEALPPPSTWDTRRRKILLDNSSGSHRVGIILEELKNSPPGTPDAADLQVARAFFKSAMKHDCEIEFLYQNTSPERENLILDQLRIKKVDAVAVLRRSRLQVLRPFVTRLMGLHIPVLTVFDDCEQAATASINFNNVGAGYAAGKILLACGHRHIAVLLESRFLANFEQRVEGLRMAIEEGGLADEASVHVCRLPLRGNLRPPLYRTFPDSPGRPTAMFCPGINLYAKILPILTSLGLRVPGNLSVIGTGNRDLLARRKPAMDLLKLDFTMAGHLAFERLHALLKGKASEKAFLLGTPYEPAGTVGPLLS